MSQSQSDPVTQWNSSAGQAQTGLEEPLWQLGLGDSYPERPDEPDCIYYLRTGFCGYGSRCRFNHPRDRGSVFGSAEAYPERVGEPVCQYYMRTGICKFGASCKYHHPRHRVGSSSTVPVNISGYPLRPGEKECSYYIKTGQCKFGLACKFHHPQPSAAIPPPPPPPPQPPESLYATSVAASQQYGVFARPAFLPGPYFPGPYGPVLLPPGMVPLPGWNPYQASVSPAASSNTLGAGPSPSPGPFYAMAPRFPSPVLSHTGSYLSMLSSSSRNEHSLPERPGEPECQYYLKTGDCKFGSSCRYHHPPEWVVPRPDFVLGPMGLPLRPGAAVCIHYSQKGVCKYGPSCRYDHPMGMLSYSPSATSLADVRVSRYPVGSSLATLAPSDLRPEANKDGVSTATASGLAGSSPSQSIPGSDSVSSR